MRTPTAEFLRQSRQRAIQEKRVQLQRQLRYAQDAHTAALNQRLADLSYIEHNPGVVSPSATSNLIGEIKEEIDYTVAAFALKQGYQAREISEAMKSEMYDRDYVTQPELVDTIVSRAQTELHHRQHNQQLAQAEL